jgi:hypothetical protein
MFHREAECVEYIKTQQYLHLFGEDTNAKMSKRFYAINYHTIYLLSKTKKFHLYEYFDHGEHIKLFLDIDIKSEHIPATADRKTLFDTIINRSIKMMVDKLETDHDISNPKVIILKSSSDIKLSAHIIFPNIFFRNVKEMKCFVTDIKSDLHDKKIIDKCVYRKGAFRCLWNSKYGANVNLEFYKGIRYEPASEKDLFYDSLLKYKYQEYYLVEIDMPTKDKIDEQDKRKNTNKKIYDKNGININNDDNKVKHPISLLKQYLDLLKKDRVDSYNSWLKIGMILYNCNPDPECFDMWDEWSKSSNYMSRGYNVHKWDSFKLDRYSIGSLKYYAKKDNPNGYSQIAKSINNIETNIDGPIFESLDFEAPYLLSEEKETIKENKSFVSSHIIDWMDNNEVKTLAIRSCYNSGKTDIITKIIKEFNPKKVLFISYRQTLTHEFFGNFKSLDFESYFEGNYTAERFICQIESLYKIKPHMTFEEVVPLEHYDLIIMDEIESILNHFVSSTITNKVEIFTIMSSFIYNAKKVLALDGDFFNRSYNFLETFGKVKVLKNTIKKDKRNYIFTNNRSDMENTIEKDLKENKNLVVVSMSATIVTYLYTIYKDKYKCILHTRHSDDKEKKKLQNVEEYWTQAQLVLYSPSVEAGVNFDVPHFHKIFMILSSKSTSPRGLLQMGSRVRKIEDNNIMVYLNNLPYKEKCNFYSHDEMKAYVFEIYSKLRNPTIKLDPETNEMVWTYEFDNFTQLLIHNQLEQSNKTSNFFVAYLIHLLKEKGHTFEHKQIGHNGQNFKKDTLLKDEVLKSHDIDDGLYNLLLGKVYENRATREDKIMIEKHKIKIDWKIKDITDTFLEKFLGKTHILFNLRWLLNEELMKEYFKENEVDRVFKMEQIEMIKEVITGLGFMLPADPKVLLDKDTFTNNYNNVLVNCKLFTDTNKSQPLFDFDKVKIGTVNTLKAFMGFINSILKDWGMIIKTKRKSSSKTVTIKDKKTSKNIKKNITTNYSFLYLAYINNINIYI